jgi:hypothetical protein
MFLFQSGSAPVGLDRLVDLAARPKNNDEECCSGITVCVLLLVLLRKGSSFIQSNCVHQVQIINILSGNETRHKTIAKKYGVPNVETEDSYLICVIQICTCVFVDAVSSEIGRAPKPNVCTYC